MPFPRPTSEEPTRPAKVCVLQPDYSGTNIEYGSYDPRRDISRLLPDARVDHVFLRKSTVYRQLLETKPERYDIYVNLCEGYLDWEIPSIDVIWHLDRLGLPYTGAPARLYDPPKELMKYVAHVQGVETPEHVLHEGNGEPDVAELKYPLFVKPSHAGDSLGIDEHSLVRDPESLRSKADAVAAAFGAALIEEYVDGREFSVLVVANPGDRNAPHVLTPIEFLFPEGESFKSYRLKITQHHPDRNVAVTDPVLDGSLREAARRIFVGFAGEGYARLDFRMDEDGTLHFLDINFACSVFYGEGSEGTADYILRADPLGPDGFLRRIIDEGIARHRASRPTWVRHRSPRSGYGIRATRPLEAGEVVFRGEEQAVRLISRRHLESVWSPEEREVARHYAIPFSDELLAIWSEDPERWAPQNHSCSPNTAYVGLDVIALRPIPEGEELTLDYGNLCDERLPPFACRCGSPNCRGTVSGREGFSLTSALAASRAAP